MTTPTALPAEPSASSATLPSPGGRVASIDVLRGMACVLMAIDHVRVYSGLPAGGPTPGIFITRWVTHFVAPAFCLLAGTGIYFLAKRVDTSSVRRFLLARGLLLVALELTVIRFLWAFAVGPDFVLAGVIWMLGWSMIALALVVGLRANVVGWLGVLIITAQPVFGALGGTLPDAARTWWNFIYPVSETTPFGINVLYVLVPWVGVMMAGYGLGLLLDRGDAERDRTLHRLGLGLTAAFLVLATSMALASGGTGADGQPAPALWMRILDQQKYPASVPFLLMTLGPLIALMPWAQHARGWIAGALEMFGRVPLWYYLMHLLVIHALAIGTSLLVSGSSQYDAYSTAPYTWLPEDQRWSLPTLYVVFAVTIAVLHPLCRLYDKRKRTAPARWMKYL